VTSSDTCNPTAGTCLGFPLYVWSGFAVLVSQPLFSFYAPSQCDFLEEVFSGRGGGFRAFPFLFLLAGRFTNLDSSIDEPFYLSLRLRPTDSLSRCRSVAAWVVRCFSFLKVRPFRVFSIVPFGSMPPLCPSFLTGDELCRTRP